ncbi:MAG TPA: RluA family pseudouridine synthase [Geobacteraceae bacterium]
MILNGTVGTAETGMRLDDGCRALFSQLSKGEIRRIIDLGGCVINQVMVRVASRTLRAGDQIALGVMEAERFVEVSYTAADLLYEDPDILAVNKAAGINSQRTPYQFKGTVEYAVGVYMQETGSRESARVIHRLDRGTSGVMFFPKNKPAATHLGALFKDGLVEKTYWAVVTTVPGQDAWEVDAPIAKLNKFRYGVALPGKEARTCFRVLRTGTGGALVEARPLTGRTHQIRVHLVHSGLPILGDTTYGGAPAPRVMLHCRAMACRGRRGNLVSAVAPPDAAFLETCLAHGIDLAGII